ncbi:MAG: metal ABC transporter permease [Burkholderiales bacterium]
MSEAFELLWLPAVAALVLIGVHTYFGLQVLARGVIFVDLALAQIAALGTTVAFMLGHAPQSTAAYAYSLGFTLLGAALLSATRGWSTRVSQEALIGVIYVVGAALAFVLVDKAPMGAEHIKQILTGNILTVTAPDVLTLIPLYAGIGFGYAWLASRRRRDHWVWELAFFASLGIVVTSSVALAGVLLVFSFLIIPAAIGVILSERMGRQLVTGWAAGILASLVGLAVSYVWDLPTGATMICSFGCALAIVGTVRRFRSGWRWIVTLRWAVATVLAISSAWSVMFPRADHSFLDAIESFAPSVRATYLSAQERVMIDEATRNAERYRRLAEELNEREVRSRAEGAAINDDEVRRISGFLRSYNEMHIGEKFVQREVRARARTRNRWWIAAAMGGAALLIVPSVLALFGGVRGRWAGIDSSSVTASYKADHPAIRE